MKITGDTMEMMKAEAIRRMKLLKLHQNAIKEFEAEDKLNLSRGGFLYWLNDVQKKMIADFEKKTSCIAYHCIESNTSFGRLLSVLYVSSHQEEWEDDVLDLKEGYPMAYVFNLDDDICSEFGSIGIRSRFGGLIRTE